MKLGSLQRVPLREVWKNEERDFSKWLASEENIKELQNYKEYLIAQIYIKKVAFKND